MEHSVVVDEKKKKFTNVPPALEGIEFGDYIVISQFPDTHKYTKEQLWLKDIRFRAKELFSVCLANGDPIPIAIRPDIPETHKKILRENGYTGDFSYQSITFYADQCTFYDKIPGEKKKEEVKTYSIHHERQDRKIVDEMIAKVDRERFIKLCNIAMGRGAKVNDKVVDKYLEEWAKAKYDYYVAFGNNLVIAKPIEFKMDDTEISSMVFDLYKKYPRYAATMEKIVEDGGGMKPFIENAMPRSSFFSKYCDKKMYQQGMKVSKFLKELYATPRSDDGKLSISEQFDIDLSVVMQNRIIKGFIKISIDPYDFLTSGTNMHGWSTCQKIWGSMAGGVFTWLTDPNALVAYRDNGKDYVYDKVFAKGVDGREEYDFRQNSFTGNSKSWRQIINGDVNTCAFLFGREYPQNKEISAATDTARELLEEVIGKYLGINDWDNFGDLRYIHQNNYFGTGPIYKDVSHHHYSDIENFESLRGRYNLKKTLIAPTGSDREKIKITAGGPTYCLNCGKKLSQTSSYVLCGDCNG